MTNITKLAEASIANSAAISLLTVGIQQLTERIRQLEVEVKTLKAANHVQPRFEDDDRRTFGGRS